MSKRVTGNNVDMNRRGIVAMVASILVVLIIAIAMMFFMNSTSEKYTLEEQFQTLDSGWYASIHRRVWQRG